MPHLKFSNLFMFCGLSRLGGLAYANSYSCEDGTTVKKQFFCSVYAVMENCIEPALVINNKKGQKYNDNALNN